MELLRIGRGGDMRYQKLEDYIATLSEKEKEQYNSLIQEFMERDIKLKKHCAESRKNLQQLVRNMEACGEAMISLKKALSDMNSAILEVNSKIYLCSKAVSRSAQYNGHLFKEYPKSLN